MTALLAAVATAAVLILAVIWLTAGTTAGLIALAAILAAQFIGVAALIHHARRAGIDYEERHR